MRVATFNILHGRSPRDGQVVPDRLAAAMRALDADVVALQEVDRDQERSGRADLTAVAAEAMGAVDHRFVAALSGTPGATWTAATGDEQPEAAAYGVALLSRHPARSWEVVRLPAAPLPMPTLLGRPPRPVVVRDEPRVAVTAVLDTPLGELVATCTHLTFRRGWNVLQLRRVVAALAEVGDSRSPRLLMGDLNMSAVAAARAMRWPSTVPAAGCALVSAGAADTFPVEEPSRQLDHVLVRGLLARAPATALDLGISDHRALVVELDRRA